MLQVRPEKQVRLVLPEQELAVRPVLQVLRVVKVLLVQQDPALQAHRDLVGQLALQEKQVLLDQKVLRDQQAR